MYLELLAAESKRHGLSIIAYCLMTNHVHLVAIPKHENSLARAIGRTHWLYSQYINRLHGRTGHLWQNRFFSSPTDELHAQRACLYVERNPVRAKLVRVPWRFKWSSAAAHVGDAEAPAWIDMMSWRSLCETRRWREQLQQPQDEKETQALRLALHRGRPLAEDGFLSKLEHRLGKRLRALPPGRPAKAKMAKSRRSRKKVKKAKK